MSEAAIADVQDVKQQEYLNDPHYSRFKLQGENRFLVRVHRNSEKKVGSIIVPDTRMTQDVETTGEVVAISPAFDSELYPDIKPGANVKVVVNSWYAFDSCGERLAFGDAKYVICAYDGF